MHIKNKNFKKLLKKQENADQPRNIIGTIRNKKKKFVDKTFAHNIMVGDLRVVCWYCNGA
jgi:hypothetical protein